MVKNLPAIWETWVRFLRWEDPLEHGNPLRYYSLDYPHGQKSLVSYSPWGCKEWDMTEQLSTNTIGLLMFPFIVTYSNVGASQVVLVVNNPPINTADIREMGSITGSESSPGGGNGNPLQYSCLEKLMDKGAWWATQSIGSQRVGHD